MSSQSPGLWLRVQCSWFTGGLLRSRSVVQFQYGEDGIDVTNNSFLRDFGFLARNAERLSQQQLPGAAEAVSKAAHLENLEQEAAKLAK